MAGASVLAARACLRSGVGLLTVHAPLCNNDILQTSAPEAMVETDVSETCFAVPTDTDVLDMIATLLSDGASVAEVTQDNSDEYGVSQIFIAIEVDKLIDGPTRDAKLQRIMDYVTTAERADENQAIRLPGHEFTTLLAENRRNGITVDDSVWAKIQAL